MRHVHNRLPVAAPLEPERLPHGSHLFKEAIPVLIGRLPVVPAKVKGRAPLVVRRIRRTARIRHNAAARRASERVERILLFRGANFLRNANRQSARRTLRNQLLLQAF